MSEAPRLLLLGTTGLIGGRALTLAAQLGGHQLLGLSRREVSFPRGARIEMLVADPAGWDEAVHTLRPDIVINALGTTRAKAGSQEAFRAVDHDLVLTVAAAAKQAGAQQLVHVSSVGASAHASAFYLKVKGQVEDALRKLAFRRLDILRPGLLRGARENDARLAEQLAKIASPVTDRFLRGSARKYRSIAASNVALAALQATRERAAGTFVHEHDALLLLASRLRDGRNKLT